MADDTFVEGGRPRIAGPRRPAANTFVEGGQRRANDTFVEGVSPGGGHFQPLPPALAAQGYRVERELGKGGEARVWLCRDPHGQLVAVKMYTGVPKYTFALDSPEYRRHFSPEWAVEVLHRGAERVMGSEMHYEVMEYCEGGTLEEFVAAHGRHDRVATAIVKRLTHCLKNLQGPQATVVHGDLKPRNVLVRNAHRFGLVLSDFGLSVDLGERSAMSNNGQGTTAYNAPEILRVKGAPADWWSLGMLMFTVLVGRGYYQLDDGRWSNQRTIEVDLISRDVDLVAIDKLAISADRRVRWKMLLAGLLTRDPDKRWGAAQVETWLAGGSPPVARPLVVAAGSAATAGAARPIEPFPWAGVGEFADPVKLGQEMAARPREAARMLSGRGVDNLVSWLRNKAKTGDDYSELSQHNWDPDAKVAYFISRMAPKVPINFQSQDISNPAALRHLVADAKNAVVQDLFAAELIGSVATTGERSRYRMIEANWADLVERANEAARDRGIALTAAAKTHIIRMALLLAASDEVLAKRHTADVSTRINSAPYAAAGDVEWFRRLQGDLGGSTVDTSHAHMALVLLADAALESARAAGQEARDKNAKLERERAQAAEAERRRKAAEAVAERNAAAAMVVADRRSATFVALGGAVVALIGLVLHIWLVPKIPSSDDWPFDWAYSMVNWPSALAQQIALVVGIVACVAVAILINATDAFRDKQSALTLGTASATAAPLIPLVLVGIIFLIVAVLAIVVAVVVIGVVIFIAIGIAGGAG